MIMFVLLQGRLIKVIKVIEDWECHAPCDMQTEVKSLSASWESIALKTVFYKQKAKLGID